MDVFERAHREWEEEDDDDDATEVCEDCGQRKCICVELEEVGW